MKPITAPDRTVCQYRGEVAEGLPVPALVPDAAEVASLREQLASTRRHLEDTMTQLKDATAVAASLAVSQERWHQLRDDELESADCWRGKYQETQCRLDELQAENADLRTRLAAAESARDTANAKASVQ